jgi:hypothetical protein
MITRLQPVPGLLGLSFIGEMREAFMSGAVREKYKGGEVDFLFQDPDCDGK